MKSDLQIFMANGIDDLFDIRCSSRRIVKICVTIHIDLARRVALGVSRHYGQNFLVFQDAARRLVIAKAKIRAEIFRQN